MKFKKIFCAFLIFIVFFIQTPVYAQNEFKLPYPCRAYILADEVSGRSLLEKNADEKLPIASITKIMTMLILAEKIDNKEISLEDLVNTSENAWKMEPSKIFLEINEKLSVRDMLKGIAISSANDASVAIAEHISGTENEFVKIMNEKAKKLNMKNTHFSDCCGLDDKNNYSSARDITIMARELITKHKWIKKYTSTYEDKIKNGTYVLHNTNKLVRFYKECTGIKTGKTDKAGFCLCSSASKKNMNLIAICLGIPESSSYNGLRAREENCKQLLEYGFNSFTVLKKRIKPEEIRPVKILNGIKSEVKAEVENNPAILVKKGSSQNVKIDLNFYDNEVKAPIKKGQVLGKVIYSLKGNKILENDIIASEDVKKANFTFLFWAITKNFFAGIKIN